MFIAQVMYAEGLVKILAAILRIVKNDAEKNLQQLRHEIDILETAETVLAELPNSSPMIAVKDHLACKRQTLQQGLEQCAADLALLERCGIKPDEYEQKFRLISADCLRISHGSVKPPQWPV